jgi:hypothetical protein
MALVMINMSHIRPGVQPELLTSGHRDLPIRLPNLCALALPIRPGRGKLRESISR